MKPASESITTEFIYEAGEKCMNADCCGITYFRSNGELHCDNCGQHFMEIEDEE